MIWKPKWTLEFQDLLKGKSDILQLGNRPIRVKFVQI